MLLRTRNIAHDQLGASFGEQSSYRTLVELGTVVREKFLYLSTRLRAIPIEVFLDQTRNLLLAVEKVNFVEPAVGVMNVHEVALSFQAGCPHGTTKVGFYLRE